MLLQNYYSQKKEKGEGPSSSWFNKRTRLLFFFAKIIAVLVVLVTLEVVIYNISGTTVNHRSLICGKVDGVLRSRLGVAVGGSRVSRILCEVDTELETTPFRDAFPEANVSLVYNTADNETDHLPDGGVAFVLTIQMCPEDDDHDGHYDDDPGPLAFYDAVAVLRDSICNCTSRNPESGSNYDATMYAIIHPDAINCAGPPGGDDGESSSSYLYDRVAILQELGFWVYIWREPINSWDISDLDLRNAIESGEGFRNLMNLYAYKFTNHPVAIMVRFDTVFLGPVDSIVDQMVTSSTIETLYSTKASDGLVNTGLTFIKPSDSMYNDIVDTVKTTTYSSGGGFGGSSGILDTGTDGILSYFFTQNTTAHVELVDSAAAAAAVVSFEDHPICDKPWNCKYDESWDSGTKTECRALNRAWYTFRKHFEDEHWSRSDLVNTTTTTDAIMTDWFLGYCFVNNTNDNGIYQSAAHYTASTPTDAPTDAPTNAPTDTPTDAPTAPPTAAPTYAPLITNTGFEEEYGTTGWSSGGSETIATSTDQAHSGNQSLLVSDRTLNWHGARHYLTGVLVEEGKYEFSGWVRLRDVVEDRFLFQLVKTDDSGNTVYPSATSVSQNDFWYTVTNTTWTRIWGIFDVTGSISSAFIVGVTLSSSFHDYYLDDVSLQRFEPTTIVVNGGFEEPGNNVGWWPFWHGTDQTVTVTSEQARSGSYSLLCAGRDASWRGAAQNLIMTGDLMMTDGVEYELTAWVKLKTTNATNNHARALIEIQDGTTRHVYGEYYSVTSTAWTRVNVIFEYTFNGPLVNLYLIVQGPAPHVEFYLDDVSIIPATPSPTFAPTSLAPTTPGTPREYVYNGDMELSSDNGDNNIHWWRAECCGNAIESSTEQAHGTGNSSLLHTNRQYVWQGASQDLLGRLTEPGKYELSGWFRLKTNTTTIETTAMCDLAMEYQEDGGNSVYLYNTYLPKRKQQTAIHSDSWTFLWGVVDLDFSGTLTLLRIRSMLVPANADFYMDDVSLTAYEPNTILCDGSFERGDIAWFPWWYGATQITSTSEAARTGSLSILVTDREYWWKGIAQNLLMNDLIQVSGIYRMSAWVKLKNNGSSTSSENAYVGVERNDDSGVTYHQSDAVTVNNSTWTYVEGVYTHEPNGTLIHLYFYCHGPSADVEFYIDDASIIPFVTPEPTTAAPSGSPSSMPSYHPTTAGPTVTGANIHPPVGYTARALPGSVVKLGVSYPGELLLLSQVITTGGIRRTPVPAGRSYDGNDWETVDPLLLLFDCLPGVECSTTLPSVSGETVEYTIVAYQPDELEPNQLAWRLLQQATFGPTQAAIDELATSLASESDWVKAQMDENITPISSHRAHFRRRVASRLRQDSYLFGVRNVCDPGSRWNHYTFSKMDIGKEIIEEATASNTFALVVDGITRTEVIAQLEPSMTLGASPWKICDVNEYVGGEVIVTTSGGDCSMTSSTFVNPAVEFNNAASVQVANLVDLDPVLLDTKILDSFLPGQPCTLAATWPNFIRDSSTNSYYVSDRRMELQDNTFDAALSVVKGKDRYRECPVVPKTFINEASCVPRNDCGAPKYSSGSATFVLNAENLRTFYTLDGLYVYRVDIDGIVPDDGYPNPCELDINHRFVRRKVTGGCTGGGTVLSQSIIDAVTHHINATLQTNPDALAIDVIMTNAMTCTDAADSSVGAEFEVGASCWTHSHPDSWSVYDLSIWTLLHPGNVNAFNLQKRNPIAKWAERYNNNNSALEDSVTLLYPHWKPKSAFDQNKYHFTHFGKWGDTIDFADLDSPARGPNTAEFLNATHIGYEGGFEVCGSINEVSNDPSAGNQYNGYQVADQDRINSIDQDHADLFTNQMVWNTVTKNAPDQMRQRVAWAFASIFVITESSVTFETMGEPWSHYYDIFVRNAFGNFFDILKEVAFNPLMAIMLTYEESKSFAYNIEYKGAALFPDENFAREIMQLFTIGLWKLHRDGTRVIDSNTGMPIPTYDNNDIVELSRGWTNMVRNDWRTNVESTWSLYPWNSNLIDPMRLPTSDGRDVFPKLGLDDGGTRVYIGDKVQRCDEVPVRSFLKRGAKYRFRGNDPRPELAREQPSWTVYYQEADWYKHLVLNPTSSQLYHTLCNPDNNNICRFDSTVVLQEDLVCDGNCNPDQWGTSKVSCECDIDQARVVRIDPSPESGDSAIYYEYVPDACVQMAFPEIVGAVAETRGSSGIMCADKRLFVGGTACCPANGNQNATHRCVFRSERVTFDTAQQRCVDAGLQLCDWDTIVASDSCGYEMQGEWIGNTAAGFKFSWSNATCTMKAQISQEGTVAIINDASSFSKPIKGRVAVDTGTYFRALWGGDGSGAFPLADNNCDNVPTCTLSGTTCICDTTTVTAAKFDGTSTFPSSRSELLENLHIGSLAPTQFQAGTYHACTAPLCVAADFVVHTKGSGSITDDNLIVFDEHTIFEINNYNDRAEPLFLSNTESIVQVGGGHFFRNPPMFNSPVDQAQRDALYEIDALIDHYFRHSNTAPFISKNLIKQLVTSNPSPRYVEAVANAFVTGSYTTTGGSNNNSFGTGKYGDLAATFAAIFLDEEARSAVLDEDPTHGLAREPIVKMMHFIRAMDLSTTGNERELQIVQLRGKIGQEVYNAPSVFSFFSPDYQAAGPVFDKGLVAPATELFDAPNLVGFLNAFSSLAVYGLSDCTWPGALGIWQERYILPDQSGEGHFSCTQAADFDPNTQSVPYLLRWSSSSNNSTSIVNELDLLLTGGRLHENNKAIIENAYNEAFANSNDAYGHERALRVAQRLIAFTPEFHITNNLVDHLTTEPASRIYSAAATQPPNNSEPSVVTDYKAIVYLFLNGAVDSYNLLIPHSDCGNSTLPQQYTEVRGDVAIPLDQLLIIDDAKGEQGCTTFGMHPSLTHVHQLYQDGDVAWVANMGNLVEPITKDEYEAQTKQFPPALFAHNTQTKLTQTVHAQNAAANGVLGRIGDILNAQENAEIFNSYSMSGTPALLKGAPGVSRPADVLTGYGLSGLSSAASDIEADIRALNNQSVTSMYGETFSEAIGFTFERIDVLGGALGESTLENGDCAATVFDEEGDPLYLALEFQQVAKIMATRDSLQSKRDVFYLSHCCYDTHSDNGPELTRLLNQVNGALSCFSAELKSQGIWNNVTFILASEFGRTFTSNGLGTDHAWGGNYFLMGGSVAGGKIHGSYPNDLTDDTNNDLNIGRGRFIPTTAWEELWHGVAQWFGVNEENMAEALPNLENFLDNSANSTSLDVNTLYG